MNGWVNQCGGRRWRTLPSGLIEVEGEGTPTYSTVSPQYANLQRTWSNWSSLFRSSAQRHGVPLSWMVAIATTETGAWSNDPARQAGIASTAGAVGVMQVIPSYQGMTVAQMQNPATNIDVAGKILHNQAARFGAELPYVAAAYNSGGVYCSPGRNEWNLRADANYPRQALTYNNTALTSLDLGTPLLASMISGGLVAAAAIGGAVIVQRWRRR